MYQIERRTLFLIVLIIVGFCCYMIGNQTGTTETHYNWQKYHDAYKRYCICYQPNNTISSYNFTPLKELG